MNTVEQITKKGDELINCTDKSKMGVIIIDFISMLKSSKFKENFEEGKTKTITDAQNLFGLHRFQSDNALLIEVKKEIRSLIFCIDSED